MFKIGQSSDIHKFCEGEFITLGGEKIAFDKGLLAHSDGDALCHAIAESILGALALGDLGHHFSDIDEANKGMSSILILEKVYEMMDQKGYQINNVDSLILIEKPKMAPHVEKMRENLAKALHCSLDQISVKATRGEGIGFVGRQEGVLAQSIVLLNKK